MNQMWSQNGIGKCRTWAYRYINSQGYVSRSRAYHAINFILLVFTRKKDN